MGGPGNTTLGSNIASIIRNSKGAMVMSSATIADNKSQIYEAVRAKLLRGDRVDIYVGGLFEDEKAANLAAVGKLMSSAKKGNLHIHTLKPGMDSHANVYYFQNNATLLLGSGRASASAMSGGSVEMLLKVKDAKAGPQLQKILNEYFDSSDVTKFPSAHTQKLFSDLKYGSNNIWESVVNLRGASEYLYRVDPTLPSAVRRTIRNQVRYELARRGETDPNVIAAE